MAPLIFGKNVNIVETERAGSVEPHAAYVRLPYGSLVFLLFFYLEKFATASKSPA